MRGRPPKPAAVKALSGRSHKGPQPARPRPDQLSDAPEPPAGLDPLASDCWRRLAPRLMSLGVLTDCDLPALEAACEAWSDYAAARRVVQSEGITYVSETQTGTIRRPLPEVAIAADGWRRYVSALARFGLTPADREKVSRGESDSDDPMLTMIEGGRA